MRILQLDKNHPLIADQLSAKGFVIDEDHTSSYSDVVKKIGVYDGLIIRSRIPIDRRLIEAGKNLKFIARVGAGMENIDRLAAEEHGITLISSPEGNRDSVAEHVLGMLLMLMHRFNICCDEVKCGIWKREENRGDELLGKTVGLIGYGNMGKAVARRFSGFGCKVIFHDILPDLSDEFGTQVPLEQLQNEADIVSLHVPLTDQTLYMIDSTFISAMNKDFYLINTARGKNVKTKDLVEGLKTTKIKGAALDVLEYEKSSFENIEGGNEDLDFLLNSTKAIITPHIAGWTHQSKEKLAQVIVDKILAGFSK